MTLAQEVQNRLNAKYKDQYRGGFVVEQHEPSPEHPEHLCFKVSYSKEFYCSVQDTDDQSEAWKNDMVEQIAFFIMKMPFFDEVLKSIRSAIRPGDRNKGAQERAETGGNQGVRISDVNDH